MTEHHLSQNQDSSATNNNLEKPVSLYLSELEKKGEKEKDEIEAVYSILLNILHPPEQRRFWSFKGLWSGVAVTKWGRRYFKGALLSYIAFALFLLAFKLGSLYAVLAATVALFIWFIFLTLWLVSEKWHELKTKNSRSITLNKLNQNISESLSDQIEVSKIRNVTTSEVFLKKIEINFGKLIKQEQHAEKKTTSIISLILFAAVVGFVLISDVNFVEIVELWNKSQLGVLFKANIALGGTGLITFLITAMNAINVFTSTTRDKNLERCLSILKIAQLPTDELETYAKNIYQSEKSDQKQSFMSRVRKISIEASADFSTTYSNNVNGEKPVEPDIR